MFRTEKSRNVTPILAPTLLERPNGHDYPFMAPVTSILRSARVAWQRVALLKLGRLACEGRALHQCPKHLFHQALPAGQLRPVRRRSLRLRPRVTPAAARRLRLQRCLALRLNSFRAAVGLGGRSR